MVRPKKYFSSEKESAAPRHRHMSCEADFALYCMFGKREDLMARSGPAAVYENKQEIIRLKKVVRQLETIIAERDAQFSTLFPAPPNKSSLKKKKVNYLPAPSLEEYQQAEEYFRRMNEEEEGGSNEIPPPSHQPVKNDPFELLPPPSHAQNARSTNHGRREHIRAETWPQRAINTPFPPPPHHQSLPPPDLPPTHSSLAVADHSLPLYEPQPILTSVAPPILLPLQQPNSFEPLSFLFDISLDTFTFSPQPSSHSRIDYNVPSYDPKAPQMDLKIDANWSNSQNYQNAFSQVV
ncbi:hypothetical protein JCM5350_002955 [Sporobolomyces pararoseus]